MWAAAQDDSPQYGAWQSSYEQFRTGSRPISFRLRAFSRPSLSGLVHSPPPPARAPPISMTRPDRIGSPRHAPRTQPARRRRRFCARPGRPADLEPAAGDRGCPARLRTPLDLSSPVPPVASLFDRWRVGAVIYVSTIRPLRRRPWSRRRRQGRRLAEADALRIDSWRKGLRRSLPVPRLLAQLRHFRDRLPRGAYRRGGPVRGPGQLGTARARLARAAS